MTVSHNGFFAGINMPYMLLGEGVHGLPPYNPVKAHRVSDYPNAPAEWSRGTENHATFFVAVKPGNGMWVDLTRNQRLQNEAAAVVSVQGINVLTARPVLAQPVLEQYRERCPTHCIDFSGNRHCKACGYDWPAQNYLSSATGKTMWIDGFRIQGSNGEPTSETRQFFFTAEKGRGIAEQLIGEAREFSIKVHFYGGPEKQPPAPRTTTRGAQSFGEGPIRLMAASARSHQTYEIGAGARIRQDIGVDPLRVEQYGAEPSCIEFYYTDEDTVNRILGMRYEVRKEGALSGLNVGNPASPHKTF